MSRSYSVELSNHRISKQHHELSSHPFTHAHIYIFHTSTRTTLEDNYRISSLKYISSFCSKCSLFLWPSWTRARAGQAGKSS